MLGQALATRVGHHLPCGPVQTLGNVDPVLGETVIKGQVVTAENLGEFDTEDYPTAYFSPSAGQVLASLGLVGLGLLTTAGIAHLGREPEGG